MPESSKIKNRKSKILMCPPDAYGLKYEINAWMSMANQPDLPLAAKQWHELHRVLTEEVNLEVELIPQADDAPDMVFTANAGLIFGNRILLSRFRHPERQVEVPSFRPWFVERGYEAFEPPEHTNFEGEGDALFAGEVLVAGYLKRTDITAHTWVSEMLGVPVLSVELVDGRWYHLDTAFFVLRPGLVAAYEGAFDQYAWQVLKSNFEVIPVAHEEALKFACNAVVIDNQIVMPAGCPKLERELDNRGFRVHSVELSEFIKSGGAAKCLCLFLDRPAK